MLNTINVMRTNGSVFVYLLVKDSKINYTDQVLQQYESIFGERYIRLNGDIIDLKAILESEKLDVIIYTDIGIDFYTYSFAYSRLTEYQIAWLF